MKIKAKEEVINNLLRQIALAPVIAHPDTLNTYACYQIILPTGYDIWINARNGLIISAGRIVNRL